MKTKHRGSHAASMLRLEARRRAGSELTPIREKRLNAFLERLAKERAVVHYEPDTEHGFFLVPREPRDTDIIRKPE